MTKKGIDKKHIEQILNTLETIPPVDIPLTPAGDLDLLAFNALPSVKGVVTQLIAEGIKDERELATCGFVAAALVLRY